MNILSENNFFVGNSRMVLTKLLGVFFISTPVLQQNETLACPKSIY